MHPLFIFVYKNADLQWAVFDERNIFLCLISCHLRLKVYEKEMLPLKP